MKNKILNLLILGSLCSITGCATNLSQTVIPTKHNKDLTLAQIAEIQPGLGTVMMEFGHRFYLAYYAAKAENWELAKYQIDELIEAQEVAEATRPKYTNQLKTFEHGAIKNLQTAIESKDWNLFASRYTQTTDACNACHRATGHPYIQYHLPKEAPKYLRMSLK